MFQSVLIANRGEIALRVMRACKELGLRTIAVYSEADRYAPHVAYADEAFLIGPPPATQSYLDIDRLIAVARQAGAEAIHPGYGFLSENPAFARACAAAGIVFVGPPASATERMGGKVAARREATAAGVSVVPGSLHPVQTVEEVRALAAEYGYPVAIKAVSGGGGRGFRVVRDESEVKSALESARREAELGFGNPEVYIEKYLTDPRHIEIQILADMHGNVIHLGERDCSVQRRHQKLIEESPSPVISPQMRADMGDAAVKLAQRVGYVSAGTVEFIYQDGHYYFLEMNTRIQVEHAVTEMVTGIDLVKGQLRVAQGEPLWITQDQVEWRGHAIECRINAEDPSANFRPSLGTLLAYQEPQGFGVRVDGGVHHGYTIPQYYDSMLAKLVVWGSNREEAIRRMRRALDDYRVDGVATTIPFHRLAIAHPAFSTGDVTVNFIPRYLADQLAEIQPAVGVAPSQSGMASPEARTFDVEVNGRRFNVRLAETGRTDKPKKTERVVGTPRKLSMSEAAGGIVSVLQGTVTAVRAVSGEAVESGEVLFIVEAMKMENEIAAPRAGTIGDVRVRAGQTIEPGMLLATYRE